MTRVNYFEGAKTKKTLTISTLLLILALTTLTIPKNAAANTDGNIVITDRTGQQTILSHEQIIALPNITENALLSCYGSQVADGQWTGVTISNLLSSVNADTSGGSIAFTAQDGYAISLPIDVAMQSNVILAYAFDSSPLQETYRLVVPEANGNVWISLVVSMAVSDATAPPVPGKNVNVFDAVNDFAQNTAKLPTPTASPTMKPNLPTQTPSSSVTPATNEPTIPPTNATNSTTMQPPVQSTFAIEPVYAAIAIIITTLIATSLVAIRQKRAKANL